MKFANCATISYFCAIECNIFGRFSRFIMEVLNFFQGRHKADTKEFVVNVTMLQLIFGL